MCKTCRHVFTLVTQIFYAGDNVRDVEQAITSDLGKIDKWYEENKMTRNHD